MTINTLNSSSKFPWIDSQNVTINYYCSESAPYFLKILNYEGPLDYLENLKNRPESIIVHSQAEITELKNFDLHEKISTKDFDLFKRVFKTKLKANYYVPNTDKKVLNLIVKIGSEVFLL